MKFKELDIFTNKDISIKERIYKFIKHYNNVSFAELSQRISGFDGHSAIYSKENPSLLIWNGVTDEAIDALSGLVDNNDIIMKTTTPMVYLVDGCIPRIKIAKSVKRKYKEKRWMPVILSVT